MLAYFLRRVLLIIPTLWGIITINFLIIQCVPGGPVEQTIAELTMPSMQSTSRIDNRGDAGINNQGNDANHHQTGLSPEPIAEIEKMYGFDKPWWQRYLDLISSYLMFDLGKSYYRDTPVVNIIVEKMPVSMSLGFWSVLLQYLICIPLGIQKAQRHRSRFDTLSTHLILLGNAIPTFLFAIVMIILFAGGDYFSIFPLRGLVSDNFSELPWYSKIADYLWHLVLPITSIMIGSFATLTMLTKNAFLEEKHKTYVLTAISKGLPQQAVMYNHIFRNAMLLVIASIPQAIVDMFFTGSLLIEIIFSLDGLGLLGYEATIQRDYPIVFGCLYVFTLIGLLVNILCDLMYCLIDKRIHFGTSTR